MKALLTLAALFGMLVVAVLGIAYLVQPEYAYMPPMYKVLNGERTNQEQAFDVWGRAISPAEADRLKLTAAGGALLSPQNGAVAIDAALLRLGGAAFYGVDPTPGVPGVNHMVTLPTFPKASLVTPDGLWLSIAGHTVWQDVNAMAAWQNTLVPPPSRYPVNVQLAARGRAVFERAGCMTCHAGAAMTNNRVIPAPEIGTEPVRAQALQQPATALVPAMVYAFDTPVPVPSGALGPEMSLLVVAPML